MTKERDTILVRNSRKIYFPIYFMILVLLTTIIVLKFKGFPINKTVLIMAGIFTFGGIKFVEFHRLNNIYEVGDTTLTHVKGIFNKVYRSLDFFAISDIDVSQTLFQRLLNYGDVNVRLFSKDSTASVKNINNPARFANILKERMISCRKNVS